MEILLNVSVGILRSIPLILLLYIPALLGMATWRERGPGYKVRTLLWFGIGFGLIVAIQIMIRSGSVLQVLEVIGLSLVQAAVALGLARLTVYRLAD